MELAVVPVMLSEGAPPPAELLADDQLVTEWGSTLMELWNGMRDGRGQSFTKARRAEMVAALRQGYTVVDLALALVHVAHDPWLKANGYSAVETAWRQSHLDRYIEQGAKRLERQRIVGALDVTLAIEGSTAVTDLRQRPAARPTTPRL